MKRNAFWTPVLFGLPLMLLAQDGWKPPAPVEDKLLDRFLGRWEGEGTHFGAKVRVECEYRWVLNHQFIQIDYKMLDMEPPYEAVGYIRPLGQNRKYSLHWIDCFGSVSVGKSQWDGKKFRTKWTEEKGGRKLRFKSAIVFSDQGYTETTHMKQGVAWKEIGKIAYSKK